jgi:murein DD-endopeptidase MepM/ murein hydrolase activator NlpD
MMHQGRIVRKTVLFASVVVFAGLATACSPEVTRFGSNTNNVFGNPFASRPAQYDPVNTNSIGRNGYYGQQRQNIPPAPQAPRPFASAPVGGVMTQPLPPAAAPLTTGSIGRVSAPKTGSSGAVAAANYPPLSAIAARSPSVTGSNQGWTAVGGTPVTVQPGENINTLSQRYGVPASAIMAVNGFSNVQQAQPGQQVMIPAYNSNAAGSPAVRSVQRAAAPLPAPVQAAYEPPLQSLPKAQPVREIMPQGMSDAEKRAAQKIAEARAQEGLPKGDIAARLAEARRAEDARKLAEAQKIIDAKKREDALKLTELKKREDAKKLEEARKIIEANKLAEAKKAEALKLAQAKKAKSDEQEDYTGSVPTKPVQTAHRVPESTTSLTKPEEDEEGDATFRWPARGKVISSFGARGTGGANDGINIAVPEGTPVRAAEGGTVVHADDALKGYGKLVLIRHANGYVSVYAHNSELNVKRGESVKRGQVIAKSGQTGNVTAPQLHFEIRKGATPVDPTRYLASN